ncbi:Matrix metalloproteinase-9 [Amphibalanus amphitrite]|uniref:Matrix metalloproteinase-9 n=1 Tax=Amphibalanus amphitrite TaxID=1232801 RepID=A0A6A4VH94_AMPAM|nr:Matrix metalloproteinase-9 [Amphibalanus amphitrite]
MTSILSSDGASAFLGFKIIRNPATVYTFSGELMTDFEEIKSLTKLGADADCVEVARSGTTLTASGACTASAEVICQQPLVRGWGTQEIAETDDLVMRTASSGSAVFADPSQWWSPAADDTSPAPRASRTCAAGFHNVVGHCVTPSAQALSQEAGAEACSSVPGVPIEFNSAAEFTLFRLMMVTHQMNESIYIGVRRSGDGFVNGAGEPFGKGGGRCAEPPATQFHRIWAPNEPASTGDCVILDPEVDFFARAVDCSTPYPTYCQPRAPRNCPADFEYQGDSYSCFHFHVDTSRVWDHTAASEYCRHKGTSLAVPRDQQQLDFIKDLVDRVITKAVDAGGSDTEHTGALGAVLLNDDGDDPNITVTINNIRWAPCYALNSSAECVFPFRYKGRVYGHCTRLDSDDGSAWCPTQLVNGEASRTNGSFATCLDSCPVRQCPVGFLEIAAPPRSAPICLLLSSYRDEEVLIPPRTPGQQRDFCERLGSRPLTLESPFHYELIKNNVSKVFPEMKGDTFQNVPCDVGMAYHACEANVEYTESGPAGGQLCQFPFTYAGRNYSSCAENTDRGQAWCATVVTGDGLVDGDNWGYCPPGDERTVAGPASPERCQFPFIAGGVRYERCDWLHRAV